MGPWALCKPRPRRFEPPNVQQGPRSLPQFVKLAGGAGTPKSNGESEREREQRRKMLRRRIASLSDSSPSSRLPQRGLVSVSEPSPLYTFLLRAGDHLNLLQQAHAYIIASGSGHSRSLLTKLLTLACPTAPITYTHRIFLSVPNPDSFLFNTLISMGDKSHPEANNIFQYLDELMWRCAEAGYVPAPESVMHQLEEEEREYALRYHSEKLAIAFGLLKTSPGSVIRIVKNIRMCEDCHLAIKYISIVTKREIVVRDKLRFHHFKDGSCSCMDYWHNMLLTESYSDSWWSCKSKE
ncbi:Pentatricopeptide repeat-containing protein At2g33760 [Linum perenne]